MLPIFYSFSLGLYSFFHYLFGFNNFSLGRESNRLRGFPCPSLSSAWRWGFLSSWRVLWCGVSFFFFFFSFLHLYQPASVWSNLQSWTEETISKSRLFTYFYRNACRCSFHRCVAILPEGTATLYQLWTLEEMHNQYCCGTILASLNSKSFKYCVLRVCRCL